MPLYFLVIKKEKNNIRCPHKVGSTFLGHFSFQKHVRVVELCNASALCLLGSGLSEPNTQAKAAKTHMRFG